MSFIEFHLLQNFAPSNLNRDDTNTPKTCVFGGFRRARISSQCQKRQIRLHPEFAKSVSKAAGDLGVRSKKLAIIIKDHLVSVGVDEGDSELCAENLLKLIELKVVKDDKNAHKHLRTQYLLYLGKREIEELKQLAAENVDILKEKKITDKALPKKLKEVFSRDSYAADVALFGRMVADSKEMNVDAACQVAQAISTNEVKNEMDFFTAMEDGMAADEQGSGMMGMLLFNSACYYRYAQINLNILKENLGNDNEQIAGAVIGFYRALLAATPSGKQNSFAAHNPASYLRLSIRDSGSPWPLTNAFVNPVRLDGEDDQNLEEKSARELESMLSKLKSMYSDEGYVFEGVSTYSEIDSIECKYDSLKDLEAAFKDKLHGVLA